MSITNNENIPDQQSIPVVEAEVVEESFVTENDFPEKSSRLEELIAKFRNENGVREHTPSSNPLANVKVKSGMKAKTFETLKPEEQQSVLARIDGIDYTNSKDILNFGSARTGTMTKHAEEIISKYAANEMDEITEPMTDLVATLKANNPSSILRVIGTKKKEDRDKEWGKMESIKEYFNMKRIKKKMHKALNKRKTIQQNLKELEVEMEKQKLSLQQDIENYQDMGKATFNQVKEFGLDCVALNLMIEDANTKLNDIVGKESELDQEEYYVAQNLKDATERMNRRVYAITSVQSSTFQTISMLAVLIKGDEIICEKIAEVIELIIPLWSWQYAIAIGAIKQQEALKLHKAIRGITSQLLTTNAKMLHDNMIAAQEELYTAAIAVEDLKIVQDYIEDMVTTVQAKAKEARGKMLEGMKAMQNIQERNYELMTNPLMEDAVRNMNPDVNS